MAPPRTAACAAIAIAAALSACTIETQYTPRTPGHVALGMQNGEPGIYKDGVLVKVSAVSSMMLGCSAGAATDVAEAADHHHSYRTNMTIVGFIYALSAFAPPMIGFATYFNIRAAHHQQESQLHLVDAINRYNDEPACVPVAAVVR